MFGRKIKKAQRNLLKAMDMMRYRTEYTDRNGSNTSEEFLSIYQAIESIRAKKRPDLTNVMIYQCVPGTGFSKLLLMYDAKRDALTSPLI